MPDENPINDSAGDSTHQGSDGGDLFVFNYGHGNDTITGFSNGEDRMRCRGW